MSKHRMPRPVVDLADPVAVAAWGAAVHEKLDAILPMLMDATQPRAYRTHGRRRIRHVVSRLLRDAHVLVDVLAPRPNVTAKKRRGRGQGDDVPTE